MAQRREYLTNHRDDLRTFLMYEPRGHSAMSGAILQPPTRPDADVGVVFIEVSGCLPMCGHGAIGVATVLAETGMVPVTEPVTTIRLDTPAGLVVASAKSSRAAPPLSPSRTFLPSFPVEQDALVEIPGYGHVRYDLAFGGNFYAIVDLPELGLRLDRTDKQRLLEVGLSVMRA
ncbi:proline racemase family protein [Micromonospora sp. BRA006-A]|nr:proline racemase family protein [Micromonospora sp. BRA006-A]